jgi:hypothetical protein
MMLGMESQYTAIVEMLQSLHTRYLHMVRTATTADTMSTGTYLEMMNQWAFILDIGLPAPSRQGRDII